MSVKQRWVTGITPSGSDMSQTAYIQHHDTTYEVVCPWCAETLGIITASTDSFTIMKQLVDLQESHFNIDCPYFLYWQRGGTLRLAVRSASPRGRSR